MRLFVAFDIPDAHKLSIEKSVQLLRLSVPDARWTRRDGWHVTLKFLGEVPDARVDELISIFGSCVNGASPSSVSLTGFGAFPTKRKARVIWAGLSEEGEGLQDLAGHLEKSLGEAGFRQESRPLKLHLTLARLKEPRSVEAALDQTDTASLLMNPFVVDQAILFRSHLSPSGATYEVVNAFALGVESHGGY